MASFQPSREGTTRIIIASDSPQRSQELNTLLEQTYVPLEVIATAQTRQTLQMARDYQPDIILFVDERADVPATEVCRTVFQSLPGTAIIVMAHPAQQEDVHYLRQLMLAGARDVLPLPPLLDNLITSIQQSTLQEKGRRQRGRARRPGTSEMGKVLLVTSAKGGTGRSVIAANVGILLSEADPNQRVVLFDMDFRYGDQRVLLDLQPNSSVLELLPVIDELTPDAVESALVSHKSGLKVLLAPPEIQQADMIEPDAVRKALIALRAYYNWVVVDLPGKLSDHELSALDFADEILQICTPDVLSIRRTRSMLEICQALGIAPNQTRLVLNRVHKKSEIKPDEFRSLFEQEIIAEIPDDPIYVQPRVDRGLPLAEAGSSAPVAKALRKLLEELSPAPQPVAA